MLKTASFLLESLLSRLFKAFSCEVKLVRYFDEGKHMHPGNEKLRVPI